MNRNMKRVLVVSGASLAVLAGTPGVAGAQMPPPGPPPAGVAPAPAAQPEQAPVTAQAPLTPGSIRIYFHTYRDKGSARVYSRQADGRYGFVCATPCTADIPANTPMRVTYNDKEEDPKDFDSGTHVGEEMAVEVKGPSAGPVIGGSIMMGVGGAAIISGVIVVAIADDLKSSIFGDDYYKTVGYVTIGLGVGLAIAGVIWFATRSQEPRIEAYPYGSHRPDDRERRRRRSRAETFLEDQALAKPRDPLAPITPAATPVSWGFAF